MSYTDLTPKHPGESMRDFDFSITPSTASVVETAIVFDRKYRSVPAVMTPRLVGSELGRELVFNVEDITTEGCTVVFERNSVNLGSDAIPGKVLVIGKLD